VPRITTYHRVGAATHNFNAPGFPVIIEAFVNVFNFIGDGSAPNLLSHEVFHITINGNGETTVLFDRLREECK
jgi:hypothetical protein